MNYLIGDITDRYWNEIKNRAEKRGIGFLISPEEAWKIYLRQNKECWFTGRLLEYYSSGYRGSASLDRIDSDKPYVVNNVQWVLGEINLMKGLLEQNYFYKLCCLVANNDRLARLTKIH